MYYLLDEYPDDHILNPSPVQLWLIITLEITIQDSFGSYLLLTYPSYSLSHDPDQVHEGYWTPPFIGHPLHLDYSVPESVGDVKLKFDQFEKNIDLSQQVEHLAYVMGLSSPEIRPCGSFIELKRSPRSPDLVKCYKIVRFYLEKVGPSSFKNLTDPECRKGHVFLPLTDLMPTNFRQSFERQRTERYFLSKPLISNIDYILADSSIAKVRSHAIKLGRQEFYYEEEGVVIAIDLSDYGTACRYAVEHMHTFETSGVDVESQLQQSICALFYRLLLDSGISQMQIAGDGLICTLPKRVFGLPNWSNAFQRFLEAYYALLKNVEILNSCIKEESSKVGSRLAIHYGKYRYGRIAEASSFSPNFEGATIVEASRLENALRSKIKTGRFEQNSTDKDDKCKPELLDYEVLVSQEEPSPSTNKYTYPPVQSVHQHFLACSEALPEEVIEIIFSQRRYIKSWGKLSVRVKEATVTGSVFQIISHDAHGDTSE